MAGSKPIIGLVGGIASGKTYVADRFAELGCLVVRSDELAHQALADSRVKQVLRDWWGEAVFDARQQVDRRAVGERVFNDPVQKQRLEQLLHPIIAERRDRLMQDATDRDEVPAFVWDSPLLIEAGLHDQCDAVVFVNAPLHVRQERARQRGWPTDELERREKLQLPLDRKRQMADYVIDTADSSSVRSQVQAVLSRMTEK